MGLAKGSTRPYLWIIMMFIGAAAGYSLADQYMGYLTHFDRKGAKDPTDLFFGFLRLDPDFQRGLLKMAFVLLGVFIASYLTTPAYNQLVKYQRRMDTLSPQERWFAVIGLVFGLAISALLISIIQPPLFWMKIAISLLVCYFCVSALMSTKEQFTFFFPGQAAEQKVVESTVLRPKILDTNVIIDGRISDVCKAGFVEGPILVPRFVLEELQQIADSSDPLKRARGRRGLDILNNMQKELHMQVKTVDGDDEYASEDVDSRLVRMAQKINGSVVTNDFNLNKVAALQGVQVLNVNELANALKPVVLPGEEMTVMIIKEGKEANQGIGYMDDGTMIVVEGGRKCIGETLDVIVTSVLQTVAGKMIFANIKTEQDSEEDTFDRSVRSYTGGRQRKKIR